MCGPRGLGFPPAALDTMSQGWGLRAALLDLSACQDGSRYSHAPGQTNRGSHLWMVLLKPQIIWVGVKNLSCKKWCLILLS